VENVPKNVAENLYELRRVNKGVVKNDRCVTYSRPRKLDNDRVDDVQKWMRELEEARNSDPDRLYSEVERIIHEMNNRQHFSLNKRDGGELIELTHQPESLLKRY
jgi:hypothetical protein